MFIFEILSFFIVSCIIMQDNTVSADGTIVPHAPFNPDEDAIKIYQAMRGPGTNEAKIMTVATKRSLSQRLEIAEKYKKRYSKSIFKALRGDLSGDFLQMMMAMFQPQPTFFATAIRNSVKDYGTADEVLTGVFCCLPEGIMDEIIRAYTEQFRRNLIKDVDSDTSGQYNMLLNALMKGNRESSKSYHSNETHTSIIVKKLVKKGHGMLFGMLAKELRNIFSENSYKEIAEVANLYEKIHNVSLASSVESEATGHFGDLLTKIVRYAQSPVSYHVDLLNAILNRGQIRKLIHASAPENLMRILVTRSEIDLEEIIREYKKSNLNLLEDDVRSIMKGDFQKACLSMIEGNK